MDIIPYSRARHSRARQDLARLMDKVSEDRAPLIVTRRGGKAVVVLSLEEYRSMEETLYLMRSPANARRLMRSIRAAERGQVAPRTLIEPKARRGRRTKPCGLPSRHKPGPTTSIGRRSILAWRGASMR